MNTKVILKAAQNLYDVIIDNYDDIVDSEDYLGYNSQQYLDEFIDELSEITVYLSNK